MRMLDLFSGIGGFALAAKWVWGDELDITGFCEIEKYAQKVLQKNFPGVPIYDDITKLNGKDFKNIDLITGGFPCQDISVAGKGAGIKEGTRSGLWSELHRIISEVQPRFALIENVPMLTIRGGTRVIADLAKIGYDCEWQIIGADDVGAWHKRKRIWIVAYPGSFICTGWNGKQRGRNSLKTQSGLRGNELYGISNTNKRDNSYKRTTEMERNTTQGIYKEERKELLWGKNFWPCEPNVGRVANGIPSRVDRLKGLGNAIVPQVAALIMERIKKYE